MDHHRRCHALDRGKENRGRCLGNRTHLPGEADFLDRTIACQAQLDPNAVATEGIHLLESEVWMRNSAKLAWVFGMLDNLCRITIHVHTPAVLSGGEVMALQQP